MALLVALLGVLGPGASPASAHAALVATDPAEGSVVQSAPREVKLTFSEGVLLSDDSLRVLDPKGKRVDSGKPRHVDGKSSTAGVALHAGLPDGTFTVAWKAVSEDSHPVGGAFTFSIGAPSKTTVKAPSGTESDEVVSALYGIGRYVAYAGFAALVGACVFAGLCRTSRPVERIAAGGWVTLFAATLALLLLRGPYTSGKGVGAVFDLGGLDDVLSTKPGAALLSRLLLLGAAAVFLAVLFGTYARSRDPRQRRDLAFGLGIGGVVVAAGIAATWSMAEHASVGIQSRVAMPVDMLHLLAVGVWLGGLVSLLATLHSGERVPRAAVQRFSQLAFGSVVVLVATGVYQSWRQLGSWSALTDTEYGRWLLVKAGLVVVVVGVASFSRRWTGRLTDAVYTAAKGKKKSKAQEAKAARVAQAAENRQQVAARAERPVGAAGSSPDPERSAQLARQEAAVAKAEAKRRRDADPLRAALRRSVLAEAAVAVVVLAVATVLSGTQPGRAETEQAAAASAAGDSARSPQPVGLTVPYDTGNKAGRGTASITIDPAVTGDNALHVFLTDRAERPVDVAELKISFTLPAKRLGPLPARLEHLSTGHWSTSGAQFPMAGEWTLSMTVRTSDIDQVTETRTVKIN